MKLNAKETEEFWANIEADLAENEPLPPQPGELTHHSLAQRQNITKKEASDKAKRQVRLGKWELVPEKRKENGRLVNAYRRLEE